MPPVLPTTPLSSAVQRDRNTQLVYVTPTDERLPKPTSVKTNSKNSGVLRSVTKEPKESERAEESSKKR
uniref:Uncharacterized protein n=1 Tax=Mycena chlorophos TaxID=658473 RepID=A0ABQ0KZV9_MYCCL|nr:predicted protein [Mycena chlorophos]